MIEKFGHNKFKQTNWDFMNLKVFEPTNESIPFYHFLIRWINNFGDFSEFWLVDCRWLSLVFKCLKYQFWSTIGVIIIKDVHQFIGHCLVPLDHCPCSLIRGHFNLLNLEGKHCWCLHTIYLLSNNNSPYWKDKLNIRGEEFFSPVPNTYRWPWP